MTGNELRWVSDWNGAAGFHLHGQTDTQVRPSDLHSLATSKSVQLFLSPQTMECNGVSQFRLESASVFLQSCALGLSLPVVSTEVFPSSPFLQ